MNHHGREAGVKRGRGDPLPLPPRESHFPHATLDFISALGSNTKTDINRAIDEFDSLGNQVGGQIANLGIRQNLLEERLEIIEEKKTVYEQLLSSVEDTDYSEAITNLSSDMLALEAAQNTFAKVTQMSLFNFLR